MVNGMEGCYKNPEEVIKQLKVMIGDLIKTNLQLKSQIEEKDDKIESLEATVADLQSEIDELYYSIPHEN